MVLAVALSGCAPEQEPGPAVSAGTTGALAVGESRDITLSVPCGVPPLEVGGVRYETSTYAAPGDGPEGWGAQQRGTLRRRSDDSLLFLPDDGTVRLQFRASADGRRLPTCG